MSREIFVFGSNLAGRHGAGAALHARDHYGAVYGVGQGPTGDAYAIPTKDERLRPLPLERIQQEVEYFLVYATARDELTFRVTKIGCGLAGYSEAQIAPMFRDAPPNCILPDGWRQPAQAPRRILVCGGRRYGQTRAEISAFLRAIGRLIKKYGKEQFKQIVVIHGDADGADTLMRVIAEYIGLEQQMFPVTADEWERIGPKAGPLRNQRMLEEGKPDAAIAFPGGRGTADMVRRLRAAGVPVWIPYGGVSE